MNLNTTMPFEIVLETVGIIMIVIFAGIKLVNIHPKAKSNQEKDKE